RWGSSCLRRAARPWCMFERTVASDRPSRSAISQYESPCQMRSTTTARCCGGRRGAAAPTSTAGSRGGAGPPADRRGRGPTPRGVVAAGGEGAGALPVRGAALVEGDRVQPGLEGPRELVLAALDPDRQEDLLKQLLAPVPVADHALDERQQRRGVAPQQRF